MVDFIADNEAIIIHWKSATRQPIATDKVATAVIPGTHFMIAIRAADNIIPSLDPSRGASSVEDAAVGLANLISTEASALNEDFAAIAEDLELATQNQTYDKIEIKLIAPSI
jgi:hypothetical protein